MKKIALILVACMAVANVSAQGIKDIIINEILVKNVDSYADDYAHKIGWIELHNSGYSKVDIAASYLRLIQYNDTTTYRIPKEDVRTIIPPQGYVVFFCDGTSNKGTFYTNFTLDQTDSVKLAMSAGIIDSKIEFLDQSGKNVIDFIEYDVNTQTPDVSFGRTMNEEGEIVIDKLTHITPLQTNQTAERIPKHKIFLENDPYGISMAIIAMSVVFLALVILYLVFKNVGKLNQWAARRKDKKALAELETAQCSDPIAAKSKIAVEDGITGETVAAIILAIHKFEAELEDEESHILTINKVAKAYSPWSSKIYSMRQLPNKK